MSSVGQYAYYSTTVEDILEQTLVNLNDNPLLHIDEYDGSSCNVYLDNVRKLDKLIENNSNIKSVTIGIMDTSTFEMMSADELNDVIGKIMNANSDIKIVVDDRISMQTRLSNKVFISAEAGLKKGVK